jgi:hypothetical protein
MMKKRTNYLLINHLSCRMIPMIPELTDQVSWVFISIDVIFINKILKAEI